MRVALRNARRLPLLVALVVALLLWWRANRRREDDNPGRKPHAKDGTTKKQAPPKKVSTGGAALQKADVFVNRVEAVFPDVSRERAMAVFPRKYEAHGHVVVAKLNPGVAEEEFCRLAECFAHSFLPIVVDRVLLDRQGIVGELRRPKLALAYGLPVEQIEYLATAPRYIKNKWKSRPVEAAAENGDACCTTQEGLESLLQQYATAPTFTLHVENGIRYSFDVDKVMFSSGNTTERMHFATVDATGETVVDMFCGIGYFALPLAVHGKPSAVHALEKNPDSVAFLTLNAVQNKVAHVICPQCGDNREVGSELVGKCDRVIMGYIPSCKEFLQRAVAFLKQNAAHEPVGVVHYHFLADKTEGRRVAQQHLGEELGEEAVKRADLTQLRCVKSYAPKQFHFVADFAFH